MGQLTWAHMMSHHLLHEAAILRAGAQLFHHLLSKRYTHLWMPIEMNQTFFVRCVSGRLANIMQKSRQLHARCREHGALKNALLFRFLEQTLYFYKVALSADLQR